MNVIPPSIPSEPQPTRRWLQTGQAAHDDAKRYLGGRAVDRGKRTEPAATLEFPVLLDDLSSVNAVAHAALAGRPGETHLGRIRFDAGASLQETQHLARMSASKQALLGLPHAGAAVTLRTGAAGMSRGAAERMHRRLVRELASRRGWSSTVLATDVEMPDPHALWLVDEAHERRGTDDALAPSDRRRGLACVKVAALPAGEGVRMVLQQALAAEKTELRGARIAIHGNGPLGLAIGAAVARAGARVVALTDGGTTFYQPTGLDASILPQLTSERGPLRATGVLTLPASVILGVPCDALVLTRPLPRIGPQLARRVATRTVIEADDGLLSPDADALLLRQRARVVPDLLGALAPEVLAEVEWRQSVEDTRWSRREVERRLEDDLGQAFVRAEDLADRLSTTLRRAAHILAVEARAQRADA